MALKLGIQTYQILTNDDEVCIPSLSSILLAVKRKLPNNFLKRHFQSFFSFSIIGSDKKVEDSENDRFMIDSNVSKTQGANFAAKAQDQGRRKV